MLIPSPSFQPFATLAPSLAAYALFLAMTKPEAFSSVLIDQALKDSNWDLLNDRHVRIYVTNPP